MASHPLGHLVTAGILAAATVVSFETGLQAAEPFN